MKYNKEEKEKQLDRRILKYISSSVKNTDDGLWKHTTPRLVAWLNKGKTTRSTRVGEESVRASLSRLVADNKLDRFDMPNKNRKNSWHWYSVKSLVKSLSKNEIDNVSDSRAVENKTMRMISLNLWNIANRLDQIDLYLNSGFNVIPLRYRDKKPALFPEYLALPKEVREVSGTWKKTWNEHYRGDTKKTIDFFAANPNLNVGCWMPDNLIAVDVDYLDDFYALNGGEEYETLKSMGSRGQHYWFIHNGDLGSCNGVRYNANGEGIMDFKTRGSLMVLPPSIHKTGVSYQWTNLVAPVEAPQLVYELYETRLEHRPISTKTSDNTSVIVASSLNPNKVSTGIRQPNRFVTDRSILITGQRYPQLWRLGRAMRTTANFEQIETELHRLNGVICDPPLNEAEMKQLINHVKYAPDRPGYKR